MAAPGRVHSLVLLRMQAEQAMVARESPQAKLCPGMVRVYRLRAGHPQHPLQAQPHFTGEETEVQRS